MRQTDYQAPATRDEQWISCQDCHAWMMPLGKYEAEDNVWETPDARGCAPGGN